MGKGLSLEGRPQRQAWEGGSWLGGVGPPQGVPRPTLAQCRALGSTLKSWRTVPLVQTHTGAQRPRRLALPSPVAHL